jgi:PAS domain S-box-containing protein
VLRPLIKILVVDDQPANITALEAILASPEYHLVTARSGEEALKCLLRDDFAVILLDVMMPDMDGFEVAALVRSRERSRSTPIIFMSATGTDTSYSLRGYEVGAVDYLAKPSDPDVVRAKVAVFVELFRKNEQIKAQAAALREHERREAALQVAQLHVASERHYRNLAEAIPQIVWTARPDGSIEYLNQRWHDLTGRPTQESCDWAWLESIADEDRECFVARWKGAIESGEPLTAECRLKLANGEARWQLCRALPEERHEQRIAWLGTFTDIDDEKRERDRAEEGIRQRDEFILVASHELNTPLTSLQLQLQRTQRALQKGNQQALGDSLEVVGRSVTRLTKLVQMLLDASRITAGRLRLEREELDLSSLAREVASRMQEEASRLGCDIEVTAHGPVVGRWDRHRIDQVLTNLVSNAVKYGDRKPVEVMVGREGDQAVVVVRDRGIGIADEEQQRIFDRFARAVSERNFGGLGLGLFIVGQIVAAHGGTIDVKSKINDGSTFTVRIPLDEDRA